MGVGEQGELGGGEEGVQKEEEGEEGNHRRLLVGGSWMERARGKRGKSLVVLWLFVFHHDASTASNVLQGANNTALIREDQAASGEADCSGAAVPKASMTDIWKVWFCLALSCRTLTLRWSRELASAKPCREGARVVGSRA